MLACVSCSTETSGDGDATGDKNDDGSDSAGTDTNESGDDGDGDDGDGGDTIGNEKNDDTAGTDGGKDGDGDTDSNDVTGNDGDSDGTGSDDTDGGGDSDSADDTDEGHDTDSAADTQIDDENTDSAGDGTETESVAGSDDSDDLISDTASDTASSDTAVTADTETDSTSTGDPDEPLEDWDMALAVDNQFDVYFGTPYQTEGECVGRGTEWYRQYLFTAQDKKPTDHLYIVTASDRDAAQGFIGTFTNVTRGKTVVTGDDVWQVFPAGAYEATNPYWPDPWPKIELPTQEQVDVAIRYAQENNLWVTPYSDAAYDNDPETNVNDNSIWTANPWGNHYDDIPNDALWIWYDSGTIEGNGLPGPFTGGNHDEFLIFRVAGQLAVVLE